MFLMLSILSFEFRHSCENVIELPYEAIPLERFSTQTLRVGSQPTSQIPRAMGET